MATPARTQQRLVSIDALRGLVMVLMALDHARDFFGFTPYDPTDLGAHDSAALFMTRWVTHFCAPVFVFLAGTSAFLWGRRHAPEGGGWAARRRVAWYLLTRGAWLILLELTVVRWAWFATTIADWRYSWFAALVIWALGWSMIVLAGLVFLPTSVVGALGVAMIATHNLLDGVDPAGLGVFSGVFKVLHVQSVVEWPAGGRMLVKYPLVPWIGVMAAGYWFGTVMLLEGRARRRVCVLLGLGLIGLFGVLRGINGYGDPSAWSGQRTGLFTVFSFVNCTKYPPSLDFLLMTLGPGLVMLGLLDAVYADGSQDRPQRTQSGAQRTRSGEDGPGEKRENPGQGPGTAMVDGAKGGRIGPVLAELLAVYGRVPLFFYVAHLVVLQFTAFAYAYARYGGQIFRWGPGDLPVDYYQGLGPVYFAWACVVMLLYPACQWLGGVKRRRRSWWVGYV